MSKIIVVRVEYPIELQEKLPLPRKPYLNVSINEVIGFSSINHLYFSGAADKGKITVVAYISNWIPKVMRKARSRYLVVKAEMIMPAPRPNAAISNTTRGNKLIAHVGAKDVPFNA